MNRVALGAAAVAVPVAGLAGLRLADRRADRREARRLAALQPAHPARFDPASVAGLPEPARRFFLRSIRPGTPLRTVAEIAMRGRIGLGTKTAPGYIDMTATETIAAPAGLLWTMRGGSGLRRVSGSDSAFWTRFRILGLLPVGRLGGTRDHARSAFGRLVAEAVFWTPAAVLPGPGVAWEAVDATTARVTVTRGDLEQAVDLTVDAEGRATRVSFMRWSDVNPDRTFRLQPFGGHLSAHREFGGFLLPAHVEAGNHFGTDDYFPFFIVDVQAVRFP